MKNKLITLVTSLVIFSLASCKKGGPAKEPGIDSAENLLTDPATGWKRVAVIPFTGLGTGPSPYNAMNAFDLEKVGDKFAVLYTQHGFEPLTRSEADHFYKVLVAPGQTNPEPVSISFGTSKNAGVNSPFTYYGQFIPGSYAPVFTDMDYTNNYIELRDAEGETYAGAPATNYPTFKYLPDGEFLAASMWVGHESFLWHYKNPPNPKGDFSSTYRPGIIEGHRRLFNIPVKGSDGSYYEFSMTAKDGKSGFMVIRCREDRIYGANPPNYEITDRGEISGLPAGGYDANFIELITYDYNAASAELTFVVADYASGAMGSDDRKNLYCFRWKQGQLSKLWQQSLDQDVDLRNSVRVFVNKNMLNEWRLRADGTFYLMNSGVPSGSSSTRATVKLWEVNASGIKLLSGISDKLTSEKSVTISTCRYFDGAYYALAYPTGEYYYKLTDPHFHMEVIKLNQ